MNKHPEHDYLELIETISHEATTCHLDFATLPSQDKVNDLAAFLSVTPSQAVLFSCVAELSLQRTMSLDHLARHLKCSILKVISLVKDLEALERQSLVRKRSRAGKNSRDYDRTMYVVTREVIEALRKEDPAILHSGRKLSLPDLLGRVRQIVDDREDDEILADQVIGDVEELIRHNKDDVFIRFLNTHLSTPQHKCVALMLAHSHLTGEWMTEMEILPIIVYEDLSAQIEFRRGILSGRNELIRTGIVNVEPTGFAGQNLVSLTKKATDVLYQEYPELYQNEVSGNNLMKASSITKKELFFSGKLETRIHELVKILDKRSFQSFRSAAATSNINRGISIIFHGPPGTGKTEAVYQIARETRRDIMMVDLSQTKSMWFGESEKQVQKIFDDYKRVLVAEEHRVPILFINEADGLLSKRMNVSHIDGVGDVHRNQLHRMFGKCFHDDRAKPFCRDLVLLRMQDNMLIMLIKMLMERKIGSFIRVHID